jgi:hypothetical protein
MGDAYDIIIGELIDAVKCVQLAAQLDKDVLGDLFGIFFNATPFKRNIID